MKCSCIRKDPVIVCIYMSFSLLVLLSNSVNVNNINFTLWTRFRLHVHKFNRSPFGMIEWKKSICVWIWFFMLKNACYHLLISTHSHPDYQLMPKMRAMLQLVVCIFVYIYFPRLFIAVINLMLWMIFFLLLFLSNLYPLYVTKQRKLKEKT